MNMLTFFNRKCGAAVCITCAPEMIVLPLYGFERETRVCNECLKSVTANEWVLIFVAFLAAITLHCIFMHCWYYYDGWVSPPKLSALRVFKDWIIQLNPQNENLLLI